MPFCVVLRFRLCQLHPSLSHFQSVMKIWGKTSADKREADWSIDRQTWSLVHAASLSKLGRISGDDMRAHAMLAGYLLQQQRQQRRRHLTSPLAWRSCRLRSFYLARNCHITPSLVQLHWLLIRSRPAGDCNKPGVTDYTRG